MTPPEVVEKRRRVVAILDELKAAGLIRYKISSRDFTGPEPRLDVWADRDAISRSAWGMGVSAAAAWMWDLLRDGRFQLARSIRALENVMEARPR